MSESFSLTEQQARDEMVRLGASFFQRGYATGSAGNLSMLLEDGNLLATPTGSCLGELQGDRLAKVTPDGEWISGDKRRSPAYRGWTRTTASVRLPPMW
jgi:ribulose-5-phosphate 4-epimerase/fuculose-1-phosphate aldolase